MFILGSDFILIVRSVDGRFFFGRRVRGSTLGRVFVKVGCENFFRCLFFVKGMFIFYKLVFVVII